MEEKGGRLLEFVGVDPPFHPVEEGGPGVRPEGRDPPPWPVRPAGRAGRGFLPDLHDPLERMPAGFAFIFVDRHGFLRGPKSPGDGGGHLGTAGPPPEL